MNKVVTRIICFLPLMALIGGAVLIALAVFEDYQQKKSVETELADLAEPMTTTELELDNLNSDGSGLAQQVFKKPEILDLEIDEKNEGDPRVAGSWGQPLLNTNQFQNNGFERSMDDSQIKNITSRYDAFASLRTDDIRNPDSAQNQLAVKSIMEKRNRRVSQLDMK